MTFFLELKKNLFNLKKNENKFNKLNIIFFADRKKTFFFIYLHLTSLFNKLIYKTEKKIKTRLRNEGK